MGPLRVCSCLFLYVSFLRVSCRRDVVASLSLLRQLRSLNTACLLAPPLSRHSMPASPPLSTAKRACAFDIPAPPWDCPAARCCEACLYLFYGRDCWCCPPCARHVRSLLCLPPPGLRAPTLALLPSHPHHPALGQRDVQCSASLRSPPFACASMGGAAGALGAAHTHARPVQRGTRVPWAGQRRAQREDESAGHEQLIRYQASPETPGTYPARVNCLGIPRASLGRAAKPGARLRREGVFCDKSER